MPAVFRRCRLVLSLALIAALAACGNKGPLVMPDQKAPPAPQPPASTAPPAQHASPP